MAAERRRSSRRSSAFCRGLAAPSLWAPRTSPSFRGRLSRTVAYVPQTHTQPFPFEGAQGRADEALCADRRPRSALRPQYGSGIRPDVCAWNRDARPARLRAPFGRATATRPDPDPNRACVRAEAASHRHGRADDLSLFQHPPRRARPGCGIVTSRTRAGHHRVDPRSTIHDPRSRSGAGVHGSCLDLGDGALERVACAEFHPIDLPRLLARKPFAPNVDFKSDPNATPGDRPRSS